MAKFIFDHIHLFTRDPETRADFAKREIVEWGAHSWPMAQLATNEDGPRDARKLPHSCSC